MADNYLERRMDDYRRGVGNKAGRPASPRPRTASFPLPAAPVFVGVKSRELRDTLVRTFASTGTRTAFCTDDAPTGAPLAHATGARLFGAEEVTADAIIVALAEARGIYGVHPVLVTDSLPAALRYRRPDAYTLLIYREDGNDVGIPDGEVASPDGAVASPDSAVGVPDGVVTIQYTGAATPAGIAQAALLGVCGHAIAGVKIAFLEEKQ